MSIGCLDMSSAAASAMLEWRSSVGWQALVETFVQPTDFDMTPTLMLRGDLMTPQRTAL